MMAIERRGVCLVLAAPSGAGKTAIAEALLASEPTLRRSISVTTRPPRAGEIDGDHYHFHSSESFERLVRENALLERAQVLGRHYYGTPRAPVEAALAMGLDMVFAIDWQGYRQLRAVLQSDVIGIFVLPPDLASLKTRLRARADDATEIARRMQLARSEISHWHEFDHVVVNADLPQAVEAVRAVLHAARSATSRQKGLKAFVDSLA